MTIYDIETILTKDIDKKESLRGLAALKEANDKAYGLMLKGHLILYEGINTENASIEEMESLYTNLVSSY